MNTAVLSDPTNLRSSNRDPLEDTARRKYLSLSLPEMGKRNIEASAILGALR